MAKIKAHDIQRIYAIAAKMGILESGSHDDMLHQLVQTLTGKDSIRDLTSSEAVTVIDDLERRSGYRPAPRRKRSPASADYPPGQMTEAQGKTCWGMAYDIIQLEQLTIPAADVLRDAAYKLLGVTINTASGNPWRMISQQDGSRLIESLKRRLEFAVVNGERRRARERGGGRGS